MNGQSGIIGDLNEIMVLSQTWPRENKGLKTKKSGKMRKCNKCVGQTRPYT